MTAGVAHDLPTEPAPRSHAADSMYARFRAWRERSLPLASYRLMPAFWTPAGRIRWLSLNSTTLLVAKRTEPQLTGLAYTARRLHLVVVAGFATYEQVARLIHCRALVRDDPDYAEHRGKRVSLILLCDDYPPAVLDFARRHRVRVIASAAPHAAERPSKQPPDRDQNRDQLLHGDSGNAN